MRSMIAAALFAAVLCAAGAAHAEKRIFIVANSGDDGYGVDRCLASSAACGAAAANAVCHTHEFGRALSYRKVDRDDITGAIPTGGPGACHGTNCGDFVAIECIR